MSLRDSALAALRAWTPPTPEQEALREQYADYLAGHASGVLREDRPHHLTASTLVLSSDGSRVLLTLHAKAQRWFQFGGHLEPGDDSLLAAAAREAREESGLDLALDPVPVQLSDHAVEFCGPGVHHLDVRFAALAPPGAAHAVSEESLDVRWWPADELPSDDADMRQLVALARARLSRS
ncbi:MAG: NUDIX domain-containing protein [Nocardioides sp.]|uniref:NUDIX domain-containing protein n=1 Tax=Nocardioides sp. TaxID=35761 RepID=UPI0039E700C0